MRSARAASTALKCRIEAEQEFEIEDRICRYITELL